MPQLTVSTDAALLQPEFLTHFLAHAYWAKGRSQAQMQTIIRHSLNFGLYLQGQQIGYARVLSDRAFFAYLLDVFIMENHRGQGHARLLLQEIFHHPELQDVKIWRLGTDDTHGLYEKFGFRKSRHPEKLMERVQE